MNRRTVLAVLALTPILAAVGCQDNSSTPPRPQPSSPSTTLTASASPTLSFAEREWYLSSPEQQRRYCTDYSQHRTLTVEDFGLADGDASDKALKELLAFLKTKC